MSNLIEELIVPAIVCKFPSVCPTKILIFDDHVAFEGQRQASYFYADYTGVSTQKASLFCAYACVIFLNAVSADQTFKNDIPVMTDRNRVLFCSGTFSYKPANEYIVTVADKIRTALENYKINGSQVKTTLSVADEIKKYKELLDMGAITQSEFETKKRQLLG